MFNDNLICPECFQNFRFIVKPYCRVCGQPFSFEIEENMICGKCIKFPPPFDIARHLFKYDHFSKMLIHAFKYNDQTYLAKILAKLLLNNYKHYMDGFDLIIPVPMHWLKRMFRMYNQSAILAKEISILTRIPVSYNLLIKRKWTKAQSSLGKVARQTNLKRSFAAIKPELIKDKKIILVDDVLTTGATIHECSSILKKSGAAEIMALTIAST